MRAHALACLCLLLGACGSSFSIHAPSDYYELSTGRSDTYDFRSTSASGIRLGVREFENEGHGSQGFWEQAVRNHLQFHAGYAVTEESELRARSGETGRLFLCGKDEASQTYDYWVAVFVADDAVFLVEAGGMRTQFTDDRDDLRAAFESFSIH